MLATYLESLHIRLVPQRSTEGVGSSKGETLGFVAAECFTGQMLPNQQCQSTEGKFLVD